LQNSISDFCGAPYDPSDRRVADSFAPESKFPANKKSISLQYDMQLFVQSDDSFDVTFS
jgi:hypothetical protein